MKRQMFTFIIIIVFVLLGAKTSYAKWVWSKETGWVDPDRLSKETSDQKFRYAITLMVNKEYVNAIGIFQDIIKSDPESELAEESQINIGRAYHMIGDYKSAFKAYEELLSQNAGTRRLKEIMEKEFQVGVSQMEVNEKGAIKVFESIIERNPLGFIAADAQVKIADSYFQLRQFEDAKDAYLRIIETFPNSEWVSYAQFRIPYCNLSNVRVLERNYEILDQSRYGFEEYMANNPQGTLVPTTQKILLEIDIAMAERDYKTGEFYLRRKKPDAGAIYFESVIKDYPDSEWADKAKEKLEMLKKVGAIK